MNLNEIKQLNFLNAAPLLISSSLLHTDALHNSTLVYIELKKESKTVIPVYTLCTASLLTVIPSVYPSKLKLGLQPGAPRRSGMERREAFLD